MERYYSFAGVSVRLECDNDFRDTEETVPFLTRAGECDFNIICRSAESLTFPESSFYQNEFFESYLCKKEIIRSYRLPTMEKYAARIACNGNIIYISYLKDYNIFFSYAKNFLNAAGLENVLMKKERYIIHCSFIELNGEAVLFSGKSGIGKSTRAELWIKYHGARLINGDRAVLYKEDGRYFAAGLPIAGSSGVFLNKTYPLKAIVFLAKDCKTRIEKISGISAYRYLFSNITLDRSSKDFMEKASDFLIDISENADLYFSPCNLSEDSSKLQYEMIYGK